MSKRNTVYRSYKGLFHEQIIRHKLFRSRGEIWSITIEDKLFWSSNLFGQLYTKMNSCGRVEETTRKHGALNLCKELHTEENGKRPRGRQQKTSV